MTAKLIEHEVAPDPDNDPDHPIPYLRVIDVAAYREGGARLIITVATPLDGDERSQTRLLDKIQGYLSHIASQQFIADAGVAPTPENTVIEVHLNPASSIAIRQLLERCQHWTQTHNASLVVCDIPA